MGCVASQPAAEPADSDEERQETKGSANAGGTVDTKDVNIGGVSTDRSGGSRTDRSGSVLNEEFVAWSEMETAEEQDYLVDEEKDSRLFERLPSFLKYGVEVHAHPARRPHILLQFELYLHSVIQFTECR